MEVILAPPADLEISSMSVGSSFVTADVMTVTWEVVNAGASRVESAWWKDKLVSHKPLQCQD